MNAELCERTLAVAQGEEKATWKKGHRGDLEFL